MQHTGASYKDRQALIRTERPSTSLPFRNAIRNQKWPLIVIMGDIMAVIEKVQENKKVLYML